MLNENLRRLREARGLSRRDLADLASVHPALIGDIERGKTNIPAYDKVVRLARALGVEPSELCPVPESEVA